MTVELPDFRAAHVVVCGDTMLDRYWLGPASRISPEAPVPVVKVEDVEERPGGAGNVALNITALGAAASLVGITGDDEDADVLQRQLHNNNVNCHLQRLPGSATVTKLRVLSRHQQLIRLDFEDGFTGYDADGFLQLYSHCLQDAGAVVLSDYGKGTLADIGSFIEAAGGRKIPVLIDPKGSDFSRYRGATLITPNLHEFETVVGHCDNDRMLEERGEALREELGLDALLVTRSEWGMSLIRKGLEPVHLTANAREVYDVTGAGDTVIAVLAACLAAGQDLVAATAVANLAASIVVAKLGTAAVHIPELRRAARDMDETERGIMDEESLQEAINDARAHGERIVMTNGCFDILHAGHVSYLEKARALGDRLIVAVNDDASVRQLKGENRPVNSLDHRMHVLSSLQSVDWVVAFSGETPEQLICRLNPDVLVKGGDYRPDDIAGSRCVRDNGGEVVVLDYIEGCSTTSIVEKLKN